MADFTIPVAFHFRVSQGGADYGVFQEVSGLEDEMPFDPVRAGGDNRFVHRLPVGVKHANLSLRRGLLDAESALIKWCKDSEAGGLGKPIEARDLVVALVDREGKDVAVWAVSKAWPVKWSVGTFDAMKNELAVETVELAFSEVQRTT